MLGTLSGPSSICGRRNCVNSFGQKLYVRDQNLQTDAISASVCFQNFMFISNFQHPQWFFKCSSTGDYWLYWSWIFSAKTILVQRVKHFPVLVRNFKSSKLWRNYIFSILLVGAGIDLPTVDNTKSTKHRMSLQILLGYTVFNKQYEKQSGRRAARVLLG